MTILFVDDDPDDFEVFAEGLKDLSPSSKCIWANNCRKAVELLESDVAPDYIFLDGIMPGGGGLDCVKELRKQKNAKAIPVVIYSGQIPEHEKDLYAKVGVTTFWKKANSYEDLKNCLLAILPDKL